MRADYRKAYTEACRILSETEVFGEFPFPIFEFIRRETNIHLARYSDIERRGAHPELFSDSAVLYQENGRYAIFYNTEDQSPQRIRFSLAHELGHYFLEHKSMRDVNDGQLKAQEREANSFAAQMLMPKQVIKELSRRGVPVTEDFLIKNFDVSESAAAFRLKSLDYAGNECKDRRLNDIILDKAYAFIENVVFEHAALAELENS